MFASALWSVSIPYELGKFASLYYIQARGSLSSRRSNFKSKSLDKSHVLSPFTGGNITKNNRRVDFYQDTPPYKIWKEIRQEMQLLEHTQECEPKYDLWPYKRQNTGGSITKNYRRVDLAMMHICTKFLRNPSRNVACRVHVRFPPKYDLWPYKRWNTGGSITKNNRSVDFTKIQLHTKFDRNPSRNAAVRAHTRMWRGGVMLLNPKYPQPTSARARG